MVKKLTSKVGEGYSGLSRIWGEERGLFDQGGGNQFKKNTNLLKMTYIFVSSIVTTTKKLLESGFLSKVKQLLFSFF